MSALTSSVLRGRSAPAGPAAVPARGPRAQTGCGTDGSAVSGGILYPVDVRVKLALTIKYGNISNAHCVFPWYTAIIRKTCCLAAYIKTVLFSKVFFKMFSFTSKWITIIIYYDHHARDPGQK